jgi:hypothetical protein
MVSRREIERMIAKQNDSIQWELNAKDALAEGMQTLMFLLIRKVNGTRTGSKRRITTDNVASIMSDELQRLIIGEEE